MKLKILFFLVLFVMGCNTQSGEPGNSGQKDSLSIVKADSSLKEAEAKPVVDSLSLYFENPVDFYTLKKQTEHMHTGGNIQLSNQYFYAIDEEKYKYYDYWAIEFFDKIEGEGCPLCFKVLKPWDTWKASEYATDNEILIGIKSMINWKWLGPSNFVGMKRTEIISRFNEPDFVKDKCVIYHQNGKLLIISLNNEKVSWFKYFWLKKPVNDINELPDKCFKWMK